MAQDVTLDYIQEGFRNYLVLRCPEAAKLIAFQVEMISQNPHPGLIPFTAQRDNNGVKLRYQLDSRVPLEQYLQDEKVQTSKIVEILDQLLTVLLESKNLLLHPAHFLLKPEYIYFDLSCDGVSLIYVPLKDLSGFVYSDDVNKNFRHLLSTLFQYRSDLPPELFSLCQDQDFQLKDFRERLEEVYFAVRKKETLRGPKEKPFQLSGSALRAPERGARAREGRPVFKVKGKIAWPSASQQANSAGQPGAEQGRSAGQFGSKLNKSAGQLGWRTKTMGLFLLLQLLGALLLLVLFPQLNALRDGLDLLGLFLVLVGVNVLFLRGITRRR